MDKKELELNNIIESHINGGCEGLLKKILEVKMSGKEVLT